MYIYMYIYIYIYLCIYRYVKVVYICMCAHIHIHTAIAGSRRHDCHEAGTGRCQETSFQSAGMPLGLIGKGTRLEPWHW